MPKAKAQRRLETLRLAHRLKPRKYSPREEDYVELIYELIKEKGYARVADISENLNVRSPTVTKMLQGLDEDKLIEYKRYRGIRLTSGGEKLAKTFRERHSILVRFFQILSVDESTAHKTAEGVEHHFPPEVLEKISKLSVALVANPNFMKSALPSNYAETAIT